jgi:hypothetical protein
MLLTSYVSCDTSVPMLTKTINLRDLPDDLVRRAKACAALHGMTLRDFAIRAISKAIEEDIPAMPLGMVALSEPSTARKGSKK